jgi:four helix bundle protein
MRDHKELDVWKKSMDFVENVYTLSRGFPKDEIYGLVSQLRRSAVSIPSNIAEGAARHSDKEFIQFLHISLGSAAEAETHLLIAQRLNYSNDIQESLQRLIAVKQMLSGLIRHYRNRDRDLETVKAGNRKP